MELGCVSAIDSNGRTIWIADAHRDDGKRFVVRADEKLTAFIELESAILRLRRIASTSWREFSETPGYENKHSISSNHICTRLLWLSQKRKRSFRRQTAVILATTRQKGRMHCLASRPAPPIRPTVLRRSRTIQPAISEHGHRSAGARRTTSATTTRPIVFRRSLRTLPATRTSPSVLMRFTKHNPPRQHGHWFSGAL